MRNLIITLIFTDHRESPSTMSLFSSLSFSEALSPPMTGRSR